MGLHSLEVEKPYKCSIIIKNTGRYSNMMSEEKRRICDNIFDYISKELDNWIDNQIFIKSSMEELGELYYNHILDKVEDADTELLNAVIRTIKPRNIECAVQKDYYIAICKILHFKSFLQKYGWMSNESMMIYSFRNTVSYCKNIKPR